MAVTNTELAAQLQEVATGWQQFVTNELAWQLSTAATVDLTDPVTGNVRTIKTYQQVITDYEMILGENPARVTQIEADLVEAQLLLTNAQSLDTAYQGYVTSAQAAATAASLSEGNAGSAAAAAGSSETAAAGSATAAAASSTNASASATAASTSATEADASATSILNAETNSAASATAAAASAAAAGTSETNAAASEAGVEADALAAAASATNAAASETAAGTSETNAAASATAAGTSETNAATSATAAGTSETNAGSSEVAAAGSATKSQEWADELEDIEVELGKYSARHHAAKASASADGVATSAANAASSATAAATSETNAAGSETAAGTSETNAAASQTAAATSETNAASSAAAAGTSETNAAASATAAGTSETNAASSATAAGTSETNTAASEAKAYGWAETGLNVEVETGKYSAFHWAEQARLFSGASMSSTDDLPEGTTNLYFTDIRATNAIKADTAWNAGNWDLAHGWGDHSLAGYLTSFTESDPVFAASPASGVTALKIGNWDLAHGWGDHSLAGYLTSFTESDPVFTASPAGGITAIQVGNWDTAYGWGNHANAGYLSAVNWGDIGGTLANQTDLQGAIDAASGGASNTDELPEGTTNLYFTNARATAAVDKAHVDSLLVNADTFDDLHWYDYVRATHTGGQNIDGYKWFTGGMTVSGTNKQPGGFYAGTVNPTATTRLNLDGRFYATDVFATSDRGLKKNISTLPAGFCLDRVTALNPVAFEWKSDDRPDHGLIAQEVEDAAPMFSTGKAVNYPKLVTYLIGAIQAQQDQINGLRRRLDGD